MNKLLFYCHLVLKMEHPLSPNNEFMFLNELDPRHCVPLFWFKLSYHRLPVVTGKFNQIQQEDRLCTLCEEKSLGNECT